MSSFYEFKNLLHMEKLDDPNFRIRFKAGYKDNAPIVSGSIIPPEGITGYGSVIVTFFDHYYNQKDICTRPVSVYSTYNTPFECKTSPSYNDIGYYKIEVKIKLDR